MAQFEVVDELASAIQLADQYCYSNTFIYTQPGNGARSMVTHPPYPPHTLGPVRGSYAAPPQAAPGGSGGLASGL